MSEESRKMAKLAVEALDDKKAEDIKVIDISKVSVVVIIPVRFRHYVIMWKKNWEEPVSLPDRPKAMRQPTGYC